MAEGKGKGMRWVKMRWIKVEDGMKIRDRCLESRDVVRLETRESKCDR